MELEKASQTGRIKFADFAEPMKVSQTGKKIINMNNDNNVYDSATTSLEKGSVGSYEEARSILADDLKIRLADNLKQIQEMHYGQEMEMEMEMEVDNTRKIQEMEIQEMEMEKKFNFAKIQEMEMEVDNTRKMILENIKQRERKVFGDGGGDDDDHDDDEVYILSDHSKADLFRVKTFDSVRACYSTVKRLVESLTNGEVANFKKPRKIQQWVWPQLTLQHTDIIGVAKRGSGKTLAFLLPGFASVKIVEKIEGEKCHNWDYGPTVAVLAPTKELVMHIFEESRIFGKAIGTNIFFFGF